MIAAAYLIAILLAWTTVVAMFAENARLGYTLNLGNPWSRVVIIVFVVALAIPLLLVP